MTVTEFAEKCSLNILALPDGGREITGCYSGDLLSWVMSRAKTGDAWVTIMSNINIVAVATLTECACIIMAESVTADQKVIELCKNKGVNLLSSRLTAFELSAELSKILL